jgi:hypothetical protein
MPYIFAVILQIALLVHAMRTGRDRMWIYILLFLPGIGGVAYIVGELIPSWFSSRAGREIRSIATRTLDPDRELRRRREAVEASNTVENRRLLAEELLQAGEFKEALQIYRSILTGIHADDPGMLLSMAKAAFGCGLYEEARQTVYRLGEINPLYQRVDAQLLYAMTLEQLGRDSEAEQEYEQLVTHAPGEEVRCRYALLQKRRGRFQHATLLFSEIVTRSKRSSSDYRRREREWIDIAKREVMNHANQA